MISGWYYLHTNGELIYKRDFDGTAADLRESDFVRHFWPMDTTDRSNAWDILVEASALGANLKRIAQLEAQWQCDDEDAQHYVKYLGCRLFKDGTAWCATRKDFIDLGSSPAGFGDTALEAFADLAKHLGFHAAKMWGAKFSDLLKSEKRVEA
jgi:hypothetical protein